MDDQPIKIPTGSLFSFEECRWFLHRNFDDCMHAFGKDDVKKALLIGGKPLLLSLTGGKGCLQVELLKGTATPALRSVLQAYITEWWDLERDLSPFYRLIRQQPQLSYMAADFKGLRLISIPDLFEAICWAIIGQQINLRFAYTIKRRMVEKYGTAVEHDQALHWIFPTPEVLAEASFEDLKAMQFSKQKAEYIITVARAFAAGEVSREQLIALPDLAARQKALVSLKGVGVWTANYALMKSLRDPSSIPHGDAGLLNALIAHDLLQKKTDGQSIERLFKKFPGWESYLVAYLWRSLAKQ